MLQNEWQLSILVRLYPIMFKIIILSQIGADRYKKLIFEILILSPPWRTVQVGGGADNAHLIKLVPTKFLKFRRPWILKQN